MDHIQSIRAFTRVVEARSFTKAAESRGVSKDRITKQIQFLEARLRAPLLNRTTRRLAPTSDGTAYYERTVRLLSDLDDIEARMANAQASPSGRLRVDIGPSVARLLVIPALHQFFARYPDIQLDLGVGDRPVDLVADNVDCVVRGGALADQSLVARRIGSVAFVTVAAPRYLAVHGVPGHPSALEQGHRLLNVFSSRTGRPFPHVFHKEHEAYDITAPYQLAVNESNALVAAAVGGLGITQVARFGVDLLLDQGALVPVLPDWHRAPVPVHVAYPPNRRLSAKVRAFVDWTVELFAQAPLLQAPRTPTTRSAPRTSPAPAAPAPNCPSRPARATRPPA